MVFEDLRQYIEQAKEIGECKLFEGADWDLEIGTITEIMAKPGAPLLLFDKIKGYKAGYQIVTNLAASHRRVCMLLGLPEENTGVRLIQAYMEKIKGGFKPMPPLEVKTGPVKENVHIGQEVDLFEFPTPKWNEKDGGRYIGTGDLVITRDLNEGWINLGTYRVQVHDKTTATIQVNENHHGYLMMQKYWAKGLACPVAVVCGQEPVLYSVGGMPLPWGISEYDYAGWLRQRPVEIVRGETTGLPIPATAEIVLEGEVVPPEIETRVEGPLGEFTGYYAGRPEPRAAFRVKSILHRNNPILLGDPPSRIWPLYWGGRMIGRAALMWKEMDKLVPGIRGVWITEDTGLPIPIISIKQQFAGHVKDAAIAGGAVSGSLFRFIIIVDDDIDPSNISEVLWAVTTRCDPATGIDILREVHTLIKDPLIPPDKRKRGELTGSVAIINACKPYSWIKEFPTVLKSSEELIMRTKKKWANLLE
jgi:UbiD family decarboxylase